MTIVEMKERAEKAEAEGHRLRERLEKYIVDVSIWKARAEKAEARVKEFDEYCDRLGRGGAERYWEARWRDDVSRAEKAEAELEVIKYKVERK